MSEPGRQVPEETFATPTIGSETAKDPKADIAAGIKDMNVALHVNHHTNLLTVDSIGLVLRHRSRGTQDAGQMIIDTIDKIIVKMTIIIKHLEPTIR